MDAADRFSSVAFEHGEIERCCAEIQALSNAEEEANAASAQDIPPQQLGAVLS